MADHGVRLHAPGEPLLGQCVRDHKEGWLGNRKLVQPLGSFGQTSLSRVEQCTQIKPADLHQKFGALVNVRAKDRLNRIQLAPHIHQWDALAGEHKHHRALRRFRIAGEDAPIGSGVVQTAAGLRLPLSDEHPAVGVTLPPGCQGIGHICEVTIGLVGEVIRKLAGDMLQGHVTSGRKQQQLPGSRWARGRTWRGLFQHDMGIGATGSE